MHKTCGKHTGNLYLIEATYGTHRPSVLPICNNRMSSLHNTCIALQNKYAKPLNVV